MYSQGFALLTVLSIYLYLRRDTRRLFPGFLGRETASLKVLGRGARFLARAICIGIWGWEQVKPEDLAGALDGVRVVEWGSFISGPFCGKVLAELGADVIKVEPPVYGDESRRHGPFPQHVPDGERSGLFLFANLNKRGITLDLESATGRELLDSLLETADIFLENQPAALTQSKGLDYESLKSRFPKLIVTSITPYGRTGPYRDYKGYNPRFGW